MIDLHMHSLASDGSETPAAMVAACRRKGLALCSVTDHDNVDAQAEALETARSLGQPYVAGVEISVIHDGELHILGYGMDTREPVFAEAMEDLRASRVRRIDAILEALRGQGVDLDAEDVKKYAGGNTLGRPHVALAMADRGYAPSFRAAYDEWLNEGGRCYVKRRRITAEKAISLIRRAGGLAVLAHPGLVRTDDFEGLLDRLTAAGLEGVEAFYPLHSDERVRFFEEAARSRGLLVTCGSDCHGAYRDAEIGAEERTSPYLEQCARLLLDRARTGGVF